MSQYQFDPNHPGIKMVDNMRMQGKEESEIYSKLDDQETKLQQDLRTATNKRFAPLPEQSKVTALHNLEVGIAYLKAGDLSYPGSREKVAMVQSGYRDTGLSRPQKTTSGEYQLKINAESKPSATKPRPGEHRIKFGM